MRKKMTRSMPDLKTELCEANQSEQHSIRSKMVRIQKSNKTRLSQLKVKNDYKKYKINTDIMQELISAQEEEE